MLYLIRKVFIIVNYMFIVNFKYLNEKNNFVFFEGIIIKDTKVYIYCFF